MNKERLLQRFLQYVTCASETYQEREFCIMMEEELTSLGLHWERQEIGEMFGSNGWNLHAILPGTGAPLLLCAHMDTVAPGYGISPILRDGVIYSDGTTILGSDDKAGIAAAMEAVQTIVEKGLPHRPIEFLLTICEENGILGSKYADYSKIISKEAIVLDNEDVGHLVNQAAAYMKIHFSIQGKSAHAGVSPEKGIHALKAVAECISGIECGRVSEISVVNVVNLLCPGQTNIVPEKADFDVEVRSYEEEESSRLYRIFAATWKRFVRPGAQNSAKPRTGSLMRFVFRLPHPLLKRPVRPCAVLASHRSLNRRSAAATSHGWLKMVWLLSISG